MPAHAALAEAGRRVGREVSFEEVSSNEDLERLLAAGPPCDLVFPSDYLIERLLKADALRELDLPAAAVDRLAGWAREEAYDPGCRWSVPFAFGTTGYLCDPAKAGDGSSWATLFDPAGPGRVGMLDEVREVIGAALIAGGFDPNDVGTGALAAARELLELQRPRVARYDSDDFVSSVVSGELVAHQAWSGPASHAVAANPHLRYVVPGEGAQHVGDVGRRSRRCPRAGSLARAAGRADGARARRADDARERIRHTERGGPRAPAGRAARAAGALPGRGDARALPPAARHRSGGGAPRCGDAAA